MVKLPWRLQSAARAGRVAADRRGVVALEFAILSVPLMLLLLGTMEVSYDFYVQAALDSAVQTAARSVQVGATQGAVSGKSVAAWVASAVCPSLGKLLDCGQLYVTVTGIPSGVGQNYYTYLQSNPVTLSSITSNSNSVCTGNPGQLMVLQAFYLSPTFLGLLVPSFSVASPFNGTQRVHAAYAASGFVNEDFGVGATGC
jgi:Flp pilus assembly protein TadG